MNRSAAKLASRALGVATSATLLSALLMIASAHAAGAPDAKFTALTKTMTTARVFHTATLLPSGQVLIAGGGSSFGDDNTTYDTAELYDPAANTFTALTKTMTTPREGHAATRLSDDQVLITGGFNDQGSGDSLNTAEVYDPVANQFTPLTRMMTIPRDGHTATRLLNDLVLITGGCGPTQSGCSPSWPIHSAEVRNAIKSGAKKRNLPIYVHATSEDEYRIAIDMGAHAIMHAPLSFLWGGKLSDSLIQALAAAGTYVVTTLSLMESATTGNHPGRLDDPLVQLTVPPAEMATARDPEADRFAARAAIGYGPRWIPQFFIDVIDVIARLVWNEREILQTVRRSQDMICRLHDAGVPIVIGTDTPGTPYFQYNFHGPTILREIELVAAAGLSPAEVLAAATRIPAEMVGLGDELGTVEIGKKADMVILDGDPLEDLGALRSIRWTIKEGVAHSPAEWMRG